MEGSNKGLKRTALYDQHRALGAKLVDFTGWEMPLQYTAGIIEEHLATRKEAGLFDVSHMGRFLFSGKGALPFLQHLLTNNAEALDGQEAGAQYTLIPNETGGAVDDAYLYRFEEDDYLLVVNASNLQEDWDHLHSFLNRFEALTMQDHTHDIAMLALQGPGSRQILDRVVQAGRLPEPVRNAVSRVRIAGEGVRIARTGYTGEPICFELFVRAEAAPPLWNLLLEKGAAPVGLGARDTLRLEAALPLYGHELGRDQEGEEIPILACPLTRFAVSFSPLKGAFLGREALTRQFGALSGILSRDYAHLAELPRMIKPLAVTGRGIARPGAKIYRGEALVGYVTSGTMVPYWVFKEQGLFSHQSHERGLRSICLGYLDSHIQEDETVSIDIRGKKVGALVVPFHLRSDAPPYARPILAKEKVTTEAPVAGPMGDKVRGLLEETLENTVWRQKECINLIPSEMTASPMVRLLSVMDPAFRYAEHRKSRAFYDTEIFYYQGTEFIARVEQRLEEALSTFLGCREVETRLISGQMANTAVFSGMLDYLNRHDRRREPRRIRRAVTNHLGRGGHLSAQPMGALRDYVAHDPRTERPAVVNFPVLKENPYKMDVPATLELIDAYRPELLIFGKSMVLHREPVMEIRSFLDAEDMETVVMYDMAHVLGLVGPHFQQPFKEGSDLVTGSTHKTYFGTQRGIVGGGIKEGEARYELWEAVRRRTFPGSVSNHHLGTLLGALMAAYEMNHFRDEYQKEVLSNAKAFARALRDCGLDVAGDPAIDFTETHQVLVRVGYGQGPDIAQRLEANNIICNYQAGPDEEGFTASGSLRLGVSEMTRFGMKEEDFRTLARLMADRILREKDVMEEVKALRRRFRQLRYCFKEDEYEGLLQSLHQLL
jgi:aminomethyltransferase